MKKTLIFLSLLLVTCKASATDHSYLIGEHSSKLFPIVGAPIEKMNNSLTGKSIWTYKEFKLLIRKDKVIQVLDLNQPSLATTAIKNQASSSEASTIKVLPTTNTESKKVDSEILGEIMKELETKTVASKVPGPGAPGLPAGQANSLQNNMLKFKQ